MRTRSRAAIALLACLSLIWTSVMFTTNTAAANSVNSFTLVTVYDGAVLPNDHDDAPNNGIVASNDAVGFRWDLNVTDIVDQVFTQTLPEGWEWDPESLGALDSSSSAYQSSYTLSPDGCTLTATLSVGTGQGNPSILSIASLRATPTGDVADNSTYTPVLTTEINGQEETSTASPITVRNSAYADLSKVRRNNNQIMQYDFGEPA